MPPLDRNSADVASNFSTTYSQLVSLCLGSTCCYSDASFCDTYPCGDMELEFGATLSYCTVGFF